MKKKILAMFSVAMLAVGMFSTSALASDYDFWDVNYTAGAPSGSANPVDYLYVKSPTGNFNASCTHIEGSSDKKVTISCVTFSNVKPIEFKKEESEPIKTTASISDVKFKVAATGSLNCYSTGYIIGY